jgi:hypothetical protein
MKRHSFECVYQTATKFHPELRPILPSSEEAQDACHLCHKLFKSSANAKAIKDAFEKQETADVLQAIDALTSFLGEEIASNLIRTVVGDPVN